jgi:iron-sulfur cluster repair protein YtfE (RIC family)
MPVQIGAQLHHFSSPVGLPSDCHRRIEMFLGTLKAVAAKIADPPAEDTARALESALRYFHQAAPNHTADEEESLFPRLRQLHNVEVAAAFSKLEQLEEDHRRAAVLHAKVERLGVQYLSTWRLSASGAETFYKAVAALASLYEEHIAAEDTLIFPLAARMLSESDNAVIAEEMASRRRVTQVRKGSEL